MRLVEEGADSVPILLWAEYVDEAAFRLTVAAREGEPLVALTGAATPSRPLLPRLLYEGAPTVVFGDGDTGKSLFAMAIAVAVHSGTPLPVGLIPQRAVPTAYLDWEASRDTADARLGQLATGLGIDPPPVLYKRMTRPLADVATKLAADFVRRGIGLVIIDSQVFALAGGDGGFHEWKFSLSMRHL